MEIIDNKIYMYRGDDEVLEVDITNSAGEAVEVGEGETVTITVRELPDRESEVVFASTSVPGSNRIIIRHEDTTNAEPGQYSADIQLLTADGMRKTIWPAIDPKDPPKVATQGMNRGNFIILSEVTE